MNIILGSPPLQVLHLQNYDPALTLKKCFRIRKNINITMEKKRSNTGNENLHQTPNDQMYNINQKFCNKSQQNYQHPFKVDG